MSELDRFTVRIEITHDTFENKRQDIVEKLARGIADGFGIDYDSAPSGAVLLVKETVRQIIENYRDPKGRVFPGNPFLGHAFIPEYERNEIEYAKFLRDPVAYNVAHGIAYSVAYDVAYFEGRL